MISSIISFYSPSYIDTLVYMLQSTEYQPGPYLYWYWHTKDFSKVMYRGRLKKTKAARLLLLSLRLGVILQIIAGIFLIRLFYTRDLAGGWPFGLALIVGYPVVWAHLLVVPLILGRWFIVRPKNAVQATAAERIFDAHPAVKIAVAGSYGKTSMKELLLTVLSAGNKKVAATPANRNVVSSHAEFSKSLAGDEDILIIEYGESKPGDVAKFANITHPTHAVITGLAPAHLDKYKTLEEAGKDIFTVTNFVPEDKVYVNKESPALAEFIHQPYHTYDSKEALGWQVIKADVVSSGTKLTIKKGNKKFSFRSGLVGRHYVGSLAFVAALALELGLNETEISKGMAKTKPFEHRMQPYTLNGATIIDDTYNGNIEGIKAGTELLKELPGKRKIYVTPGLVDQGKETEEVHQKVGRLIAAAHPDQVVLIKNSVTEYIKKGLEEGEYGGRLIIESDPLTFYTNLSHFVAAGDLVVMQNDWPDQYK